MIIAKFGNNKKFFSIKGHAQLDETGKDILCSAVSALVQSTCIGLEKCAIVKETASYKGNLVMVLKYRNMQSDILIWTLRESLLQLEEQYPLNLSVTEVS